MQRKDQLKNLTLETNVLSVGDRIRPGIYKLHSRFKQVVNLTDGTRLISVVHKQIGAGPINLVVENLRIDQIDRIKIGRRSIVLAQQRYRFTGEHLYNSAIEVEGLNRDDFENNRSLVKERLIGRSQPSSLAFIFDKKRVSYFNSEFEKAFVKRMVDGVEQIRAGQIIRGVKQLKGCGWGLTPSGDDFIAGLLLGLNVIQQARNKDLVRLITGIYEASRGGNIFSEIFLKLAKEGRAFERFKRLISALNSGDEKQVKKSATELLSVGATSGADLMTGFLITFELDLLDISEKPQLRFSRRHSSQPTVV